MALHGLNLLLCDRAVRHIADYRSKRAFAVIRLLLPIELKSDGGQAIGCKRRLKVWVPFLLTVQVGNEVAQPMALGQHNSKLFLHPLCNACQYFISHPQLRQMMRRPI